MATDGIPPSDHILAGVDSDDWSVVLRALEELPRYLDTVPPGHPALATLATRLASLARHPKWEVRRAVAQLAGRLLHATLDTVIPGLLSDDNARVRQAANQAVLRRRDWRTATSLGQQHEQRLTALLTDIEARFGLRGREAVKRVSEEIANTFASELYHEMIRLISPLVTAADRLHTAANSQSIAADVVKDLAERIGRQATHLRAVLDAMRTFAAAPRLKFAPEGLSDVIEEAASLARSAARGARKPQIILDAPSSVVADVVRSRLVQAFTNLLVNAIEAYDDDATSLAPIRVSAQHSEGLVVIEIEDGGCGMSAGVMDDAPRLFSTSKPGGTGVGLPLAIKIIESEHQGRVSLRSRKNVGTTVTVTLPSQQVAVA